MALRYRVIEPQAGEAKMQTVLLHGRGSDEEDLLPLAGLFGPWARVYSLRAPIAFGPGWAWYGFQRDGSTDLGQWQASVEMLDQFLEAVVDAVQPVLLMGFSQGGMMAQAVAVRRRGNRLGGVISLSAPPLPQPPEPKVLSGLPVFWGHGSEDPVVVPKRGEETLALLETTGALISAHRYPISHTIGEAELEDIDRWIHDCFVNN